MTSRILFVCLGNICRSPMAEGVFRARAEAAGLIVEVDSAGTSNWHIGKPPDARAVKAAAARGVDISEMRARQVTASDMIDFTHVLAMDQSNLTKLRAISSCRTAPQSFLDYAPGMGISEVPDPYYDDSFDTALDLIEAASEGLIRALKG